MNRSPAAVGKFLLLVTPQIVASSVMIWVFTRISALYDDSVALHILTISAVECAFFLAAGLLATAPGLRGNRTAPYVFATALFAKFLALNLVYAGSVGSNLAWGGNLSLSNVRTAWPHLEGFRAAFGNWIFAAAAGFVALLLGLYAAVLRLAHRLFHTLLAAVSPSRWPVRQAAIALLAGLAAAEWWLIQMEPARLARADPIISFWGDRDEFSTAMFADLESRRDYPENPVFARRNVLVFSIDSLRADHLSFYGYGRETTPFLAQLQAAGRLRRGPVAFAVGNSTPFGVFGMLGSRFVESQHPSNVKMYDLLKQFGYHTYLLAAGDHTDFQDKRQYYGPNFDVFSDGITPRSFSVNDDRGLLEALEAIPPADDRPAFFFFHLMSVHSLGVHLREFERWPAEPTKTNARGRRVANEGDRAIATYDAGVLQADDFLRRIFAVLERKGYLRDYVGVIAGDHGESLGEHGYFGHARSLFREDTGVPILWIDSGTPPAFAAEFASQVDIAPTLFEQLGLPVPGGWEGLPLSRAAESRLVYLTAKWGGPWRGVVAKDGARVYKYLFLSRGPSGPAEMLFELSSDPYERTDLIATAEPALLHRLRAAAATHFAVKVPHYP